MTGQPLAVVGTGLVTGVGLYAPAACAAIRCAIDGFQETRFRDAGGDWIIGCEVPLEQPWRGTTKLVKMLAMAVQECAATVPQLELEAVPILLCFAEADRPGRLDQLTDQVAHQVSTELGIRFHEKSLVIEYGRVGTVVALRQARRLIYEARIPRVLVAGVDSLLIGSTLQACEKRGLLLTSQNSDGFIPGEAASALLLQAPRPAGAPQLICRGLGFGVEPATEDSEEPLRADGLVKAIRDALADAGCEPSDLDFRITDISGSQYRFREATLALSRILRTPKEEFALWHPADCIGEVGAAIGGVMIAVIDAACRKGYSKGHRILFHLGNDDGKRTAMVFGFSGTGT
ncbi:3-oxoacyl-ACP synthase [Candidatus Thiosymbion oneisti]|uniref:3-oxoacyl-ACP synthase n=1 Tax=Candidatus Thiosymbion oneisti TaxID=589554 RepID=UPI000A467440|nr:3-oxoacyl-ACP synthase [Candidatus Thiosymbion oneisti]